MLDGVGLIEVFDADRVNRDGGISTAKHDRPSQGAKKAYPGTVRIEIRDPSFLLAERGVHEAAMSIVEVRGKPGVVSITLGLSRT
jgi:hypothetical protein